MVIRDVNAANMETLNDILEEGDKNGIFNLALESMGLPLESSYVVKLLEIARIAKEEGAAVFGEGYNPSLGEWSSVIDSWIYMLMKNAGNQGSILAGSRLAVDLVECQEIDEIVELARKAAYTPIVFLMGLTVDETPQSIIDFRKPLMIWQEIFRTVSTAGDMAKCLGKAFLPIEISAIDRIHTVKRNAWLLEKYFTDQGNPCKIIAELDPLTGLYSYREERLTD